MRGILVFSLLTAVAAMPALAQGNAENVRSLNARVLQFHGAMQRANPAQAAEIRGQAGPVLAQRAVALNRLMKENPGAALGLAFAQDLLADLAEKFPGSANSLEKQGEWSGVSEHLIFDDPARGTRRTEVRLRNGNETIQLYSANGEPHCVSGNTLTAKGVRLNNVVAAGSTTVQNAGAVAAAGCVSTGAQKTAVILVQFPGVPLPSTVTPAGVNDIFFSTSGRSVNTFWQEASSGKASASGAVFGPYTLNRIYTCDEYSLMRSAAIAAADADAVFTNYSRVFIVFPNPGSCGWAGLGSLGCTTLSSADGSFQASTSWLLASYMESVDNGVKLASHEGGHNLTLHHASSRDFGAEAVGAIGTAGTLNEYGDPLSVMGSWNFGHYAVPHKVRIGWLSGSNVLTTEANGTYALQPVETPTAGIQALKVRRGTGNNAWMWVEYRRPTGLYHSTLSSQVFGGGLVHYEDSTTGTFTHLLDFTTDTSAFTDPALTGTWVDPYSNVSLGVSGAGGAALTVNVNYGALPCSRVAPTLTLTPPNPSVAAGASTGYSLSIKNNDTAGCAASTLNLGSTLPSGWATAFNPPSLALTPGQTLTATMTKSVPAGFTPGTYPVDAGASDANHAAVSAGANITVTAPSEPISVAVTASPTSVAVRGTVRVRAVVSKASGPVAGASVVFTLTRPGGGITSKSAVTDATGAAVWDYRAQQKGSYSVKASASSAGATATSAAATFTAN